MKDLLIFFDNQTFKLNNIIINYIKRWIVYKIINNYNDYSNICLYKTYPEFVEKKITLDNIREDIQDILIWINNVIYKKYESYPTKCFKNIIDKINQNISYKDILVKNNTQNEIIIFCSISNYEHNFTETNIIYINDILNDKKMNDKKININLINICCIPFLKQFFPKINEEIIDINCLKTENIKINKMINSNNKNIDANVGDLLNINKYIDYDSITNICKFTKDLTVFEYLLLMFEIENYTHDLISTNSLTKQDFFQMSNVILDKICFSCETNHNSQILNIFKSYKNSIKDIILRQMDISIILPIDKLTPELSTSYIKYILEFYSIIYPKINYYNSMQNSSNKQKNKQKNIIKSTSNISIGNIKNFDLDENDISYKYLTSSLTITNWVEEYLNANPFGFIIKYNPCKLSYKGIYDSNSSILKTYPNIVVNNITTNFVPLYDYYQIILFDYENNKDKNENEDVYNNNQDEKKKMFNISNFNITDNINGNGNVMIPLYINKSHWELTKSLWSYHISFINNCFEQEYNNKMDNIYFYAIFKNFNDLKNLTNNKNIKSIIRLFCYLLRTCIQILIDNKFIHSVKNDYKKYFNLVLNLETLDKNSIFADWIIRLIQLIIGNGINDEELKLDLNKITNFVFDKYIIDNYKMDFWDMINDSNISNTQKKSEIEMLKIKVIQDNICWLYLNFDLQVFNKMIKSIYNINGFNQFIKQIDKTNGCLIDTNEMHILNIKNLENIIKTHNEIQFDIDNYQVDISKYYSDLDFDEIVIDKPNNN